MRITHILLILAAAMLLGAGALLAHALIRPPAGVAAAPVVSEIATRGVLVARIDLPAGHFLQASDFDWREQPVTMLRPQLYVQGADEPGHLAGSVLMRSLRVGETIQRTDLVSPRERGFLAAVLPPGKRSASVAVDEVTGSAGLIFPGDRVDVILTHTVAEAEEPGRRTLGQAILQDIRVLAVDQAMNGPANPSAAGSAGRPSEPQGNARGRAVARTVTLEIAPREAEKLAVAVSLGRLSLALRSLQRADTPEPPSSGPVWAGDVLESLNGLGSAPAPPALDEPDPVPVRQREAAPAVIVYRGGSSK